MPLLKNQIIPLKILSLSSDGNGVGKYEGMTVFVPLAAQGDEILCKIVKLSNTYAFGIIDSFYSASPLRTDVQCELFGKCGGCQLRHISYASELKAKQSFVADAMSRLGGIDAPVSDIIPSPDTQRYRNKVQLPVYTNSEGKVRAGFFAPRSHRVLECSDCLLQPELFSNITNRVCELLSEYKITTYDEIKRTGLVRHLYLRHSVENNTVMLCIVINGKKLPYQEQIVANIIAQFSEITSVVLNINRACTNVILGNQNITLHGDGTLADILCKVPVALSPLSFFQVNTRAAERLYSVAALFAMPCSDDVVLDLYCGAGTIGLSIADKCQKLIGVEIVPEAIESAKLSAKQMGFTSAEFICSDAGTAADKLHKDGQKIDIVIVDPPRKGCDELTIISIVRMQAKRIVMVSCNASTAARDAHALEKQGYKVSAIQPVDMFPRTRHVECVVLLTKK